MDKVINNDRIIKLGNSWILAHSKSGTVLNFEYAQFRHLTDKGALKLYHNHAGWVFSYHTKSGACTCGAQPRSDVIARAVFFSKTMYNKHVSGFKHWNP